MSTSQNPLALLLSLIVSISTSSLLFGQTPTPTPPDTDGDGVRDHKDGWPKTSQIKSAPVPDSQYVVIDLGPGVAYGINNLGDVVGKNVSEKENTGLEAILWQLGQPPKFLGFLTEDTTVPRESVAYGINDSRQITGGATYRWDPNISGQYPDPPGSNSWGINSDSHAFVWQNGAMTDLNDLSSFQTADPNYPDPSNKVFSVGRAINNPGTVVGQSDSNAGTNDDDFHWFVVGYAPHATTFLGAPTDLGITQTPDGESEAKAINDNGAIVGYGAGDGLAAFYRLNGVTQIIGPSDAVTNANGVNNLGHAVGNFGSPGQASLWVDDPALPAGARIVDLHAFGQTQHFTITTATAINDRDQIVGQGSINNSPSLEAILWQNGKLLRLNDLIGPHPGFTLRSATAISQNGMIVANDPNIGLSEAYVLLPVIARDLNGTDVDRDDRNVRAGSDIWIKPLPNSQYDTSREPQIQALVIGLNDQFLLRWRMSIRYPRRQGQDDKEFANTGGQNFDEVSGDRAWNIFPAYSSPDQFFGGDATIFVTVLRSDRTSVTDERSFNFKILGKNPDDTKAHQYISSLADPLGFPWAWAIAKHESKGPSSGTVYNQFAEVNGAWGKKGEPWHNRTEGNGWGMFQRDDTGHGIPVTTNQVWDWQENAKVAIQQDDQGVLGKGELQQKRDSVDRVFDDYRMHHTSKYDQQPPPHLDVEGHTLPARDVLTMETYNGAGKIRELLVFTPANPVGVGPGKRWQWSLPNAPSQSKPYVNLVMIESNSEP